VIVADRTPAASGIGPAWGEALACGSLLLTVVSGLRRAALRWRLK
jgi:hypothetical protein